jgi:hypothetical protein
MGAAAKRVLAASIEGRQPMKDRNGNTHWCEWCGNDLPDHRMHHRTCRPQCTNALNADDERRLSEAAKQAKRAAAAAKPVVPGGVMDAKCSRCGGAREDLAYRLCVACRAGRNTYQKGYYARRKADGKCFICGQPSDGHMRCPACRQKQALRKSDRCSACHRPNDTPGQRWCSACRANHLENARRSHAD